MGFILPLVAHKIPEFIPGLTIKWQLVVGMSLQALFLGLSAFSVNPNSRFAYAFLPAFGVPNFTWVTILTYAITGLHVPHSQLGTALGLLGSFRSTGGAVGNAFFGTLFKQLSVRDTTVAVREACQGLGLCPDAATVELLLAGTIEYNQGVNGTLDGIDAEAKTMLQNALRLGYGRTMQVIFLATIPLSVLALVCSLWIEDPTPYMNNHVHFRMYEKGGSVERGTPRNRLSRALRCCGLGRRGCESRLMKSVLNSDELIRKLRTGNSLCRVRWTCCLVFLKSPGDDLCFSRPRDISSFPK